MLFKRYQGKPSRPVPQEIIQEIQDQLHETARHLVDFNTDPSDRLQRYKAVTRVHILSLMRGIGNGRYSRWYRESHYIHHPGHFSLIDLMSDPLVCDYGTTTPQHQPIRYNIGYNV